MNFEEFQKVQVLSEKPTSGRPLGNLNPQLNELNKFDTRFISRALINKTLKNLEMSQKLITKIPKPIEKLTKELKKIKGGLKILGFFRIPGSKRIIDQLKSVKTFADWSLRDLKKVKLDKTIRDLRELFMKMDSLNDYIDSLEKERDSYKKQADNLSQKLDRKKEKK